MVAHMESLAERSARQREHTLAIHRLSVEVECSDWSVYEPHFAGGGDASLDDYEAWKRMVRRGDIDLAVKCMKRSTFSLPMVEFLKEVSALADANAAKFFDSLIPFIRNMPWDNVFSLVTAFQERVEVLQRIVSIFFASHWTSPPVTDAMIDAMRVINDKLGVYQWLCVGQNIRPIDRQKVSLQVMTKIPTYHMAFVEYIIGYQKFEQRWMEEVWKSVRTENEALRVLSHVDKVNLNWMPDNKIAEVLKSILEKRWTRALVKLYRLNLDRDLGHHMMNFLCRVMILGTTEDVDAVLGVDDLPVILSNLVMTVAYEWHVMKIGEFKPENVAWVLVQQEFDLDEVQHLYDTLYTPKPKSAVFQDAIRIARGLPRRIHMSKWAVACLQSRKESRERRIAFESMESN